MADALLLNTFQKISPAYELVADVTVSVATTQVDFSGLNFGKDDDLLLVCAIYNPLGSTLNYDLTFNGNNTRTNYYNQTNYNYGTTVQGQRSNIPKILDAEAGSFSELFINIKLTNNGYIVCQSKSVRRYNSSAMLIEDSFITSTFTTTSITSLRVSGVSTNQVGVGSRFQLYRLKAKKVADIIVSSPTTQVDITSLNLDKDSEYMLLSDCVHNGNTQFRLYANANYTDTNYYTQYMVVGSTSVSSNRVNYPYLTYNESGLYSLNISMIKLTNNGYVVSQNNIIDKYSSNLIGIRKAYITSTFTTTSITSIRVASDIANGIGSGSRFTLYRLDDGVATPDSSIRKVGNLVYMTSDSAPSPYVATVSPAPTSNSAYMAFDATNSTGPTWNYITTVAWAKMVWTDPIRIKEMIVRANRSGQANTAIRVYGIKADASEISLYSASPSNDTDITITPSDTTTPFVGVRMEIDGRSDLIVSIRNCRITQWYTT